MSIAVKEILRASRPPGAPVRADKYLPDIAQDLRWLLAKSQRGFTDRSVVWPEASLSEWAAVLVEFGEDLHADCGLWRSLENYNREFFGTPLPLAVGTSSEEDVPNGFDPRRIQHLIWTLWMEMDPEVCPSPSHANLLQFAKVAGTFLTERFTRLPADSGVKTFLAGSSRLGWEIKRKLVWLGTKSYLLRWFFDNYVNEHDEGARREVRRRTTAVSCHGYASLRLPRCRNRVRLRREACCWAFRWRNPLLGARRRER